MKFLIIANWKMNPRTLVEAKRNFKTIKRGVNGIKKVETVICAPFIFLSNLKSTRYLKLGAQDCFWGEIGAFTGEVSAKQLKSMNVEYVILGHSERRKYLGESTELVNQKIKAALMANLKVIFCVGSGTEKPGEEIKKQLKIGLKGVNAADINKIIFVYEPIWAISTTKNRIVAKPSQALKGGFYMKKILEGLFDRKTAQAAKIIYGGSVDSKNVKGFLKEGKMDGGLPGAASLSPNEFIKIVKEANRA